MAVVALTVKVRENLLLLLSLREREGKGCWCRNVMMFEKKRVVVGLWSLDSPMKVVVRFNDDMAAVGGSGGGGESTQRAYPVF